MLIAKNGRPIGIWSSSPAAQQVFLLSRTKEQELWSGIATQTSCSHRCGPAFSSDRRVCRLKLRRWHTNSQSSNGGRTSCFLWEPVKKQTDGQARPPPLQPGHPHLTPPSSGELAASPRPTPPPRRGLHPAPPPPPGLLGPPSHPEQQTKNTY